MPKFDLVRSIDIDAPAGRIRDVISDFNTWPTWSPWLIMERDAKVTYKGTAGETGHGYDWEGKKTGAGGMTMTALSDTRMDADLQFLKPFKSQADVGFTFEPIDDAKTKVSWSMNSGLPFFMFFMVNKMKAFISNDYDRGLRLLKDYIESGSTKCDVSVEGVVQAPSTLYAGKTYVSSMANMSDSMGTAFPEVFNAATEAGGDISGMPFSIYNKMDMVSSNCTYTAAIPLSTSVDTANGVSVSERPECKAMKIVHTGPYRHLGNAWATGMSDMRHAKLKASKAIPPFEIYVNDPENTPEEALITEIYMPVR